LTTSKKLGRGASREQRAYSIVHRILGREKKGLNCLKIRGGGKNRVKHRKEDSFSTHPSVGALEGGRIGGVAEGLLCLKTVKK